MEPEGSSQAANNAIVRNVKPAHAIPADVFKNHFNISLPSTPRSSSVLSHLSVLTKQLHKFVLSPLLPQTPHFR